MSDDLTWTREAVVKCAHCGSPMIPDISSWDDKGCAWNCTTYGCPDWEGGGIEAEDLVSLGCPEWVAERMEALAEAVFHLENPS